VSESDSEFLEARVVHRIQESLTVDVSLSLGCETGILFGPSGSGKTTLLRLIAGLARPALGRVCLGGKILFDSAAHIDEPLRNRRIGMIFQDDRLFPHLSVAANIRFGLKGWQRKPAHDRLTEVAALCGVEHLLGRMPETLSGGERQRVGLARALAPHPRLLLCDEPVSALDLANRHALLEQLRKVQQALAIPMLYVTHSPAEALAIGSRLFLLEAGRIVAAGTPLDVLSMSGDAPAGSNTWEGFRNVFPARITNHDEALFASRLELEGGPSLTVPSLEHPVGTRVLVAVRADDVLLSREPLTGLSARNQIAGQVERLVRHGPEAEVIVRTGKLAWIVSVVEIALEELAISPGAPIQLIIKARSCHILGLEDSPPKS
jgi:molybdate transport system ATP-binding protein